MEHSPFDVMVGVWEGVIWTFDSEGKLTKKQPTKEMIYWKNAEKTSMSLSNIVDPGAGGNGGELDFEVIFTVSGNTLVGEDEIRDEVQRLYLARYVLPVPDQEPRHGDVQHPVLRLANRAADRRTLHHPRFGVLPALPTEVGFQTFQRTSPDVPPKLRGLPVRKRQ